MTTDTNKTTSNQSQLTELHGVLLNSNRQELLGFIIQKGEKNNNDISQQDAEDILGSQNEILSEKGIASLLSKKILASGQCLDEIDEKELLIYLKRALIQRISDFFRKRKAIRRDTRVVIQMDDYSWSLIPDKPTMPTSCINFAIYSRLNLKEQTILDAWERNSYKNIKTSDLLKSLTPDERRLFSGRSGKSHENTDLVSKNLRYSKSTLLIKLRVEIRNGQELFES